VARRYRPVAGQRARDRRTGTGAAGSPAPAGSGPAPAPIGDAGPAGRPPRRGPSWWLVALLCAAVVLATAALWTGYRAAAEGRVDAAGAAAVAAARQHAPVLLSYDYRTLDRDFARAGDRVTGGFAKDYAATTSRVVRPAAQRYKAVVRAQVQAAALVRAEADRATVLLFVDQTTTSTRLDGPKVDLNRVRMTLTRVDGRWLVSDVDAL
jgi:Mce-associated membrane protein